MTCCYNPSENSHVQWMTMLLQPFRTQSCIVNDHVITSLQNTRDALAMLQFALQGGVTSVRDMAGDVIMLSRLATQAIAHPRGPHASPRVYSSALLGGPSFFREDERMGGAAHGYRPGILCLLFFRGDEIMGGYIDQVSALQNFRRLLFNVVVKRTSGWAGLSDPYSCTLNRFFCFG